MHIRYLNGHRLARALQAGARRLVERARDLDAINVFPVPDGDTGSNMAATVMTMRHGLLMGLSPSLGLAARAAADGALDGARGNSGAIIAQFLHGLAVEIGAETRMGARAFSAAVGRAVDRTFRAVSRPREGTILTVLKAWAERISNAAERFDDYLPMLREGLEAARAALQKTRETLAEARKAGVVDAGAQGFVHFLEGIMHLVDESRPRDALAGSADSDAAADGLSGMNGLADGLAGRPAIPVVAEGPLTFRYCSEARLQDLDIGVEELRGRIDPLGDSLVLAGGRSMLRVHLHTDRPQHLFHLLARVGKLLSSKVDDMLIQRELAASKPETVLVIDSSCDLHDEERRAFHVDRIPVRLEINGESLLDGDGVEAGELHKLLAANPGVPASTSQPLRVDIERKLSFLLGVATEVLYLGPAAALSGTLDAGKATAATLPGGERVTVIDSKAISAGSALLARKAAEAIAAGASAAEAAALVEKLRPRLGFAVAIPCMDRLALSGRLPRSVARAAGFLGLRPLVGLDPAGRLVGKGLYKEAVGPASAVYHAMRRAARQAGSKNLEIIIAQAGAMEEAEKLARLVESGFHLVRPATIVTAGAALAAHSGAGVVAAAWLGGRDA